MDSTGGGGYIERREGVSGEEREVLQFALSLSLRIQQLWSTPAVVSLLQCGPAQRRPITRLLHTVPKQPLFDL